MTDIPLAYGLKYIICAAMPLILFTLPSLRKGFGKGRALTITIVSAVIVVIFFPMAWYSVGNFRTDNYLNQLAIEHNECINYRKQLEIMKARTQFRWSGQNYSQFKEIKDNFEKRKNNILLYQPDAATIMQLHSEVNDKNKALIACSDEVLNISMSTMTTITR